jgi:hypothetical protein
MSMALGSPSILSRMGGGTVNPEVLCDMVEMVLVMLAFQSL